MTRLWSEDYMSTESDEETYGPRPEGQAADPVLGEVDSLSILAEGARTTCCPGTSGINKAATNRASPEDPPETVWLPTCCPGRGDPVTATVASMPTWGSFTTTGDQTEKQAAAFAASVEQVSREAEAPLLAEDARVSDESSDDDDMSLEVTEKNDNNEDSPYDEDDDSPKKRHKSGKGGRARRGFGLLMAGMFPKDSTSEQDTTDGDFDGTRALDLEEASAPMESSTTELTPQARSETAGDAEAQKEPKIEAADFQQRDAPGDAPADVYGPGTADLTPIGGEKDLESATGEKDLESAGGSTKHDTEDEHDEDDDNNESREISVDDVVEKRPRRSCCCCCMVLLCLLLLGGLGAFFTTGYYRPGFLKTDNKSVDDQQSIGALNQNTPGGSGPTDGVEPSNVGSPSGPENGEGEKEGGGMVATEEPPQTGTGNTPTEPVSGETPTSSGNPGDIVPEPTEPVSGATPTVSGETPTSGGNPGGVVTQPLDGEGETSEVTFGFLANIPFDNRKGQELSESLLDTNAAFILHVGSIRDGSNTDCRIEDYQSAASILVTSSVPVWILPGPGDWSMCDNVARAQNFYRGEFLSLTEETWETSMPFRQPNRPYNFAWEANDNVMVIGLDFLAAEEPGAMDEIFAWTKAVSENFSGDQIILASYSIPLEFMVRLESLGLPNVLYVRGSNGASTDTARVVRATARLKYALV